MRKSHRVQFVGRHGGMLSGILEIPSSEPQGWMLFSHCFTCNKDLKAIVRIARGLSDRGWGVLRYDFAGLGGSEGSFSETNFTTNCHDLKHAADFLSETAHPPRFLIGHSFGGAASFAMADQLPSVTGVIGIAAPSDTTHLADLLVQMAPSIETEGHGIVTIGGQHYQITKAMVEDFRKHRLREHVQQMRKAMLVFHSPVDETVRFEHALVNAGFRDSLDGTSHPLKVDVPETNHPRDRSLVALPGSNHLLTTSERDIAMMVGIMDAWCERWI